MKKVLAWLALPVALCLVAGGAWLAVGPLNLAGFGSTSETRNTEVINAVTREEQVVLLSLGIQGISATKGSSTFVGVPIPGSERASFLQYSFTAKLGIEGKDVEIRQAGENAFVVSIPEFIFIGHGNEKFETVVESNGVLSFATPEIDTAEVVTAILNDDAQAKYITSNRELLRDQAASFYTGIISGIAPGSTVTLEFAGE